MKALKLAWVSLVAFTLSGCFKLGGLNELLTYEMNPITGIDAKRNLSEEGMRYVKEKNYDDAETVFASIKDFENLEKLALIYLKQNKPKRTIEIYRLLEENNYPIKPAKEVLEKLSDFGYTQKNN